jgi:DNA-binding transcriptional MerR regulator
MSAKRDTMFIGEAANLVGVSVKALRLYERLGLLRPPLRTACGYRVYSRSELDQLRLILWARNLGLRLREVKELLAAFASGRDAQSVARAAEVVRARLAEIQGEIRRLRAIESRLRRLLVAWMERRTQTDVTTLGENSCDEMEVHDGHLFSRRGV